jgi:hypothetical protein
VHAQEHESATERSQNDRRALQTELYRPTWTAL